MGASDRRTGRTGLSRRTGDREPEVLPEISLQSQNSHVESQISYTGTALWCGKNRTQDVLFF